MSTTANIGLNQSDYITINRTESSTSTIISSETSNMTRTLPMNGESKSDWLTAVTPPSQEEAKSVSKTEDGRQLITEASDSGDHKTGSVENGQASDATPPRNVLVTSESTTSPKKVGEGEGSLAPSSSRETGATAAVPSGGSELQLPAKQALAVLSSVSKN